MQSLVFHARVPHQVMPSIQVMCARRGKALEKIRGPTFLRSTDVVGKQALKVCSAEPPGRLTENGLRTERWSAAHDMSGDYHASTRS